MSGTQYALSQLHYVIIQQMLMKQSQTHIPLKKYVINVELLPVYFFFTLT